MGEQQRRVDAGRASEQQRAESRASERLAEIMAWHGMARYAEPDALAPYLDGAEPASGDPERGAPPDG